MSFSEIISAFHIPLGSFYAVHTTDKKGLEKLINAAGIPITLEIQKLLDEVDVYIKAGGSLEINQKLNMDGNEFISFEWFMAGKHHREDGPAQESFANGEPNGFEYNLYGLKHREDGPAVNYRNGGILYWYKHDELHRDDGPAVEWHGEYNPGSYVWYNHGVRHRDGDEPTLVSGKEKHWVKNNKPWRKDGLPHVEKGKKKMWLDAESRPHRDDGPAIIYAQGKQEWYQHGKKHREDGPAIIYTDGTEKWCFNGLTCTKATHQARLAKKRALEAAKAKDKQGPDRALEPVSVGFVG